MKTLFFPPIIATALFAITAASPQATFVGCREESDGFVSAYGGCYDTVTGLVWSAETSKGALGLPGYGVYQYSPWADYVGSSTYAGYSDWRLPTRDELVRLANRDVIASGTMADYTAEMRHVVSTGYDNLWSSTAVKKGATSPMYTVVLGSGAVYQFGKSSGMQGIAVRYVGPQAP